MNTSDDLRKQRGGGEDAERNMQDVLVMVSVTAVQEKKIDIHTKKKFYTKNKKNSINI